MLDSDYVVLAEDEILRRVKLPPPDKNESDLIKILPDGKKQITRLAFRPHPERDVDGLSVNIIGLAASPDVLYDRATHLAVKVVAQACFDLGLTVDHNPLSEDHDHPDYSHALMNDLMDRKDLQATLAESCEIID